jgi:hypothetical protein
MQEVLGTSGLDTLPPAEARPLCELEPSLRIQRMPTAVPVETMEQQPPAATPGATRALRLRRRKRPLPTETETEDSGLSLSPSARRRPDGEGGGPLTPPPHLPTTLGPNIEAGGTLAPGRLSSCSR